MSKENIPTHDPQTGELNPHYEELTGNKNPLKYEEFEDAIDHINDSSWEEKPCQNVRRFQYGDFPEIIYVIKTGFKNEYLVVNEDAYHLHLGKTSLMTKSKVERTYNIKL